MHGSISRSLGGPALKPQGPAAWTLDPGPSTLTLPPVGGGGDVTGVAEDTAHLVLLIEAEAAYTPGRVAPGAA